MTQFENPPTTLPEYLAIARRRKWIILALPVVAAFSAYIVSQTQQSEYRATAQVLVNRSSIVSAITNISDPTLGDATRFLTTQAEVARAPALASRVIDAARVRGVSAGELLGSSSVTPESDADVLDVSVTWSQDAIAQRLANAYATEFTRYKTELDTKRIEQALASLRVRIKQLQSRGATATAAYSTLLQDESELETVGTLLANNTSVLRPAGGAAQVQPRPTRNALLGAILGIVLGIGLAFAAEALDRRVRSEDEFEEILGAPLLGRLPRPPKDERGLRQLVMLANPTGRHAESFRKLKTSIEFLDLGKSVRTVMITSALPQEGKSTTAANLAIAFARTGRRVALVDLDLRRPSLHSLLITTLEPGISDVVMGGASPDRAFRSVRLPALASRPSLNGHRRAARHEDAESGVLTLLPAGKIAPNQADSAAEFLESDRLRTVLDELRGQFDLVLIDTPPLLAVGDAMALTARVDAVLLVLQSASRRPLVREVSRELERSRAMLLGFALTGLEEGEAYGGYGYGAYEYDVQPAARPPEHV